MKYIKFILTQNISFTVEEDQALAILKSQKQLIPILGKDKKWTGETINKAHIIATKIDYEVSRSFAVAENTREFLYEINGESKEQDEEKLREIKNKISNLLKKGK